MRLYWVDAFFDKIEHSSFDGQNRLSLNRITQLSHPFGLTIFEGKECYQTLCASCFNDAHLKRLLQLL